MKYSFVALALAAAVSAQTINDIPSCARPCIEDAVKSETTCALTDIACVCKNFSAVQGVATGCVLEKCGPEVAVGEVLPAVEALCKNPPAASTGSSSATSEPAGTTSHGATATGTTIVTSATKSECTPSGSNTVAPPPSASNTVPPTGGPAPTPVPTAGAAMFGPIGGLALAAIGALAL